MEPETQAAPNPKWMTWTGWVLTVLPVLMLVMSAVMKLMRSKEVLEGFAKSGYPENVLLPIAITEIICTILYVIPRTTVLGAILLTGYLGGAIATHVRAGEVFAGPLVFGILVWAGLFLRDARVRALIPVRRS